MRSFKIKEMFEMLKEDYEMIATYQDSNDGPLLCPRRR